MLYDGAIRFLSQSAAAMRHGDRQKARDRMRRAEAIIDELNVVLDMEKGGKIARDLRSIYLFCKRSLNEATTKQEPQRIDAVVKLLSELRGSWETLAVKAGA
jgi:flagellar protein FliS